MPSSDARQDVVARLLGAIRGVRPGERALVGVDGVDGSGKTMLARELVARAATGGREVHAVSNLDPYSGANVIARGIVGTRGDAVTVASPMFKQVFDLRTGVCLETHGKPSSALRVWPTTIDGDRVLLQVAGS